MKKPKAIIYDNDGMITHGTRFSDAYSKEFGMDLDSMTPFFVPGGPLEKCLLGKSDLKEELQKIPGLWGWKGTVEELMQYWFATANEVDADVYASITKLKQQGLVVCLATNQETNRFQHFVAKFSYDKIFDEMFYASELKAFKHSAEGLEKIFQTLKEKYGILDRGEILYWDDRKDNVETIQIMGFNAQLHTDFPSFQKVLSDYGYSV